MPADVALVVLVGVTLDAAFGSRWLGGTRFGRTPDTRSSPVHP